MSGTLHTITVELADAAAADKTRYVSPPFPGNWEVVGVTYVPSSAGAVAVDGTDYRAISVKNGSDVIASTTTFTGGTAHVAGTAISMSVTRAYAKIVGQSGVITILSDSTGATGKVANGHLCIALQKQAGD